MERRRIRRKRGFQGIVTIHKGWIGWFSNTSETTYQLIDISVEGMCIICRNPTAGPKVGDSASFHVQAHRVLPFKAIGRVAWTKPWGKGQAKILGIKFEKLGAAARGSLEDLFRPRPRILPEDHRSL